jgi:hypothetical protein
VTQVIIKAPAYPCLLQHYFNSQAMETAKMSHNQGMEEENVIFIHSGILLSHKKE